MKNKNVIPIFGIAILTAAAANSALPDETINYTYDARGRLVTVEHNGTVNNGLKAAYTIDKSDNRKHLQVTGSPNPSPP